jgi:heptosyltransferase-2
MERILVVGPSWVGDMVMAQSLFRLLEQESAGCRISVLAPAWSAPVTARMPEVAESIAMTVGHGSLRIGERWRLGRALRGRFDRAIILPGSFKSALVPWLAGVPLRTGYTGEQRYGLLNDRRRLDREAMPLHLQRVAALALPQGAPPPAPDAIPWPRLRIDPVERDGAAKRHGIDRDTPLVALCPGAEFGPAKQWPAAHFAALAGDQLARGRQVAVFGSERDAEVAARIRVAAPGALDLTGRTSLGEAIDLLSLAAHVVTNDSGLMHVAAAVGSHVVAIYGSSSDQYTPPLHPAADRLGLSLDCRPCFQRQCPLGHLECLNGIPAERVSAMLEESPPRESAG